MFRDTEAFATPAPLPAIPSLADPVGATLRFIASDAFDAAMDRIDRGFIALCAGRIDRTAAPWVSEADADDAARVIVQYPAIVWG